MHTPLGQNKLLLGVKCLFAVSLKCKQQLFFFSTQSEHMSLTKKIKKVTPTCKLIVKLMFFHKYVEVV